MAIQVQLPKESRQGRSRATRPSRVRGRGGDLSKLSLFGAPRVGPVQSGGVSALATPGDVVRSGGELVLATPGDVATTVRVADDTHMYSLRDGSKWWSAGYAPICEEEDEEGRGQYFAVLGGHVSKSRVLYCKIAGAQHYPGALQETRFSPGAVVMLRPEPVNPYDENAVGVWDRSGSVQVGYIPAEHSEAVGSRIFAGERLVAFVIREIRRESRSGLRAALHILVVPVGDLQLSLSLTSTPEGRGESDDLGY